MPLFYALFCQIILRAIGIVLMQILWIVRGESIYKQNVVISFNWYKQIKFILIVEFNTIKEWTMVYIQICNLELAGWTMADTKSHEFH